MCITKACEEPTSAGVWWRDDAGWKQYNATQAAAILQGVKDGATRLELGNLVSPKSAGGASYVVDLTTMKQINLASVYTRDVKVVQAPVTAPANAPATAPATAATDVMTESDDKERLAFEKSVRSSQRFMRKYLYTKKDQSTRNEQVEFQQTLPEQTNQVAELAVVPPGLAMFGITEQTSDIDRQSFIEFTHKVMNRFKWSDFFPEGPSSSDDEY